MTNHIKSIHDEGVSWCGEPVGVEFHFKTVEQAVLNGLHESKNLACAVCTKLIIECLTRRTDAE